MERPNVTTFIQNERKKKIILAFNSISFFESSYSNLVHSSFIPSSLKTFVLLIINEKILFIFDTQEHAHRFKTSDTIFRNYETFKYQIVSVHTTARLYLTRLSRFAHNRIATHCSNFKTEPLSTIIPFGSRSITCKIYEPYK